MASAIGPGAVMAIIGAGVAAVLALWWHSTLAISGLGGWLTGAGQVLGLLAVAALTEAGVPRRRIHCESFTSGGYIKSPQSALDNGV